MPICDNYNPTTSSSWCAGKSLTFTPFINAGIPSCVAIDPTREDGIQNAGRGVDIWLAARDLLHSLKTLILRGGGNLPILYEIQASLRGGGRRRLQRLGIRAGREVGYKSTEDPGLVRNNYYGNI